MSFQSGFKFEKQEKVCWGLSPENSVDGAKRMSEVLLSVLVGALFIMFGLFLNTSRFTVDEVLSTLWGDKKFGNSAHLFEFRSYVL